MKPQVIVPSKALRDYARRQGAFVTPHYGEEARRRAWETVKTDAWILHDIGLADISPDTLGIPRPEAGRLKAKNGPHD